MVVRLRSGWRIFWTLASASVYHNRHHQVYSFALRSSSYFSSIKGHRLPQQPAPFHSTHRLHCSSTPVPSDSCATMSSSSPVLRFVDIGANLLDERYTDGVYFGKKRHEADFDEVLARSIQQGVTHIILTAGTLAESRKAVQTVEDYRAKWQQEDKSPPVYLGCTVGVHPTRCQQEFIDNLTTNTANDVLDELTELLSYGSDRGYVVAIGEFGLDYDRLEFTPKDVQIEFFKRQLDAYFSDSSRASNLPFFLHNRSVGTDLLNILKEKKGELETTSDTKLKGVVHSFDDTLELAQEFMDLGFYIGLNGCSLKTEENLSVVKELPLSKILLETDCPYCEIKATHAGHKYIQTTFSKKPDKKFEFGTMVKGRNEPNQIIQVAEVIAGAKGITVEEVAESCYQNSMDLYAGSFASQ